MSGIATRGAQGARATGHALFHLMLADARERVRRYSFLLTLGLAVLLAYAVCTGKIRIWLGDVRGIYDSAWVGALMALATNTFLSLIGFFVVRNAVERDRTTGVGEILATTPMTRFQYALGKAASNYVVLLGMAGVMALAAPIGQLVAGEDRTLRLWPLLSPFLFLVLPALALIAATAVLFEMVPGLRSVFGNFVWIALWGSGFGEAISQKGLPDPFGLGRISADMFLERDAAFGGTDRSFVMGAISNERKARLFHWQGIEWTGADVLHSLAWLGVAVGIALLAALFFDRFARTSRGEAGSRAKGKSARQARKEAKKAEGKPAAGVAPAGTMGVGGKASGDTVLDWNEVVPMEIGAELASVPREAGRIAEVQLTPLPTKARRFRFFDLLKAELRLALQGQSWWWYLVLLGLAIAALTAPLEGVKKFVLPIAWIWPIAIWSGLGSREARFGTAPMVLSGARPLSRQLPAAWLAGVLVAMLAGGAAGARFAATGAWGALGAWTVGALFIPTLALALGAWSGSRKFFEVVYFLLWYLGPLQQVPPLDYLGAVATAQKQGMPWVYLALTVGLGVAGVVGRRRQLVGDRA